MEYLKRDEDGLSLSDDQQLETLTATSVANLMREQDADLLASHHALGANEPDPFGTPMCESVPAMIRDVPNLMLSAAEEELLFGPNRPASGEAVLIGQTQASPHKRRPTLSGQVFLTGLEKSSLVVEEMKTTRDDQARRSGCMDRHLSEAAQFAAAVGAEEVTSEIRIIDNYYDDDDDDESSKDKKALGNSTVPMTSGVGVSVEGRGCPSVNKAVSTETTFQADLSSTLTTTALTSGVMVGRPHKQVIKTKRGFLDQLPGGDLQPTFIYKGIHSNPPEIVQRGIQRGNYAQLHRKAWLEVSDKYHRYGKNLRLYYRYWEKLGCPFNMFFDWLDSKGEAAGQPLPELEKCPRAQLDSDVVLYISNPDVTEKYTIGIIVQGDTGAGLMVDNDGDPIVTGQDGWIFVLRDNRLYGAQKISSVTGERMKQRFHHSSFFGGKAVEAAGIFITDDKGYLTQLLPHSGHYRPGESHMQRVLFFLYHMGIDLRTFDMDMQQILHVARDTETGDGGKVEKTKEKKKKIESLCLQPAVLVACFLAHKARFIGNGIFKQIHKIRNAPVTNVTEALELIDDGGCW